MNEAKRNECTAPPPCSLFLVICDGEPRAAYPRRLQAEVYASGFSKPVEIVAGIFTADADIERPMKPQKGG